MNTNTIEQQIELEKHYTSLAQEAFKKRLEQARNQGKITSQPLGSGLILTKGYSTETKQTKYDQWDAQKLKG